MISMLQKHIHVLLRNLGMLICICLFLTAPVMAKSRSIEVNYLNVTKLNNELRLDAEIAYELNSDIREALVNGIPLMFQIEVLVKSLNKWPIDKVISAVTKTYRVKYHALSKQYILESLDTGESDTFPDLESVLLNQGKVNALYVTEMDYLDEQKEYVVLLRSQLLSNKLPLPLRMKSYFSPKWRLDSGWYEWPL